VHQAANRRVFYDFISSPPKSVSIAALADHDNRIVETHDRAITEALEQLQNFAAKRAVISGMPDYAHILSQQASRNGRI
jgi:conjugative relaxase-like TrwC/TraI family protein